MFLQTYFDNVPTCFFFCCRSDEVPTTFFDNVPTYIFSDVLIKFLQTYFDRVPTYIFSDVLIKFLQTYFDRVPTNSKQQFISLDEVS